MRGGALSIRGEAARYSIYIFELYRPYSFLLTAFILSGKRRKTKEKGFDFIICRKTNPLILSKVDKRLDSLYNNRSRLLRKKQPIKWEVSV